MQALALTDRQERFVHEYLVDHNGTAAARRAGYAEKSCGSQAAELMANPRVQERVAIEMGALFSQLKLSALEMLRMQMNAACFDPAKMFDEDGEPLPLRLLEKETKQGLTVNYEQRRGGPVLLKVKQVPRHVALAGLWRRFDNFQRIQERVFGIGGSTGRVVEVGEVQGALGGDVVRPLPVLDIDLPEVKARAAAARLARAGSEAVEAARVAQQAQGEAEAREAEVERVLAREKVVRAEVESLLEEGRGEVGEEVIGEVIEDVVEEVIAEAAGEVVEVSGGGEEGVSDQVGEVDCEVEAAACVVRGAAAVVSEVPVVASAAPSPANDAPASGSEAPSAISEEPALQAARLSVQRAEAATLAALAGEAKQASVWERARAVAGKLAEAAALRRAAVAAKAVTAVQGPKEKYRFADDPAWMWGGRRAPTPEPEMHPLAIRQMQDARQREQREELLGGTLRKNGVVMVGGREQLHVPGYNPPWAKGNARESYAVGAGEGIFEHYGRGD